MAKKATNEVQEEVESNCMHLEQYIGLLQDLLKKEGNLAVTYSMDDEGNGYGLVCYAPSCVAYEGKLLDHDNALEIIEVDDAVKRKVPHFKAICIN